MSKYDLVVNDAKTLRKVKVVWNSVNGERIETEISYLPLGTSESLGIENEFYDASKPNDPQILGKILFEKAFRMVSKADSEMTREVWETSFEFTNALVSKIFGLDDFLLKSLKNEKSMTPT